MGQNSVMSILVNGKIEVTAQQGNPCQNCGGEEYVTLTKWDSERAGFTAIRWCSCGAVTLLNWVDGEDCTYDDLAYLG